MLDVFYRISNFVVYRQLNEFKYSKSLNISIWPIDRILAGTTTPGLSRPECNHNERVLHIPQSSRTGASTSNGLVSYAGHSLRVSYSPAEMQLVYSTVLADWAG